MEILVISSECNGFLPLTCPLIQAMKRVTFQQTLKITLQETNIPPENRASQKESSIPTIHFSGAMLVPGRVTFFFGGVILYVCVRPLGFPIFLGVTLPKYRG